MTEYTPGPWKVGRRGYGHVEIRQPLPRSTALPKGACVAAVYQTAGIDKEECEANARLIAAAPELLEALQKMLDVFGEGYEPGNPTWRNPTLDRALAAIAKATGEAS